MSQTSEFELNQRFYNRVINSTDIEYLPDGKGWSREISEEESRQDTRFMSDLGNKAFFYRKSDIWDCPAQFGTEQSIEYWEGYLEAVQQYLNNNKDYFEGKYGEKFKMDSNSQ